MNWRPDRKTGRASMRENRRRVSHLVFAFMILFAVYCGLLLVEGAFMGGDMRVSTVTFFAGSVALACVFVIYALYPNPSFFSMTICFFTQIIFIVVGSYLEELEFYSFVMFMLVCCVSLMKNLKLLLACVSMMVVIDIFTMIFIVPRLAEWLDPFRHFMKFMVFLFGSGFILVHTRSVVQQENAASRALATFSSLLRKTPNYMLVTDSEGRVRYISDPMLGFTHFIRREFAVGQPLIDLFHDKTLKLMFADILDADGFYETVTKINVAGGDRYFKILADKLLGRGEGVFIDITDITQTEKNRVAAEEANKLLRTVNNAAVLLLQSKIEGFTDILWSCMGMIGKAVGADRVYIWKNRTAEDGVIYSTQLVEWSEGAPPRQDDDDYPVEIPLAGTSAEWLDTLSSGRCINAIVREMTPGSQAQLSPQGVLSVFAAPIFLGDHFWGFAGIDDCHRERVFPQHLEESLYSAVLMIGNAFQRVDDITKIINMQSELRDALEVAQTASDAKSNFLATMSHEIRTPMNAILGVAQIELQKKKLPAEYEAALENIQSSGMTLLGIINDILDFSKIESGKFELNPAQYELANLINAAVQLNIVRVGSKPVEFVLDIDERLPSKLYGDELRLKQILNNLLSNAIKYTESGEIRLTVKEAETNGAGDHINLSFAVTDTGQGMRDEDLDKLFSRYMRLNMDTNRAVEGIGLGLSITRKLVELMDGKIRVESVFGRGSTFTVLVRQKVMSAIPIGAEMVKQLGSLSFAGYSNSLGSRVDHEPMPDASVLVVDDLQTNLYVAEGLLAPYQLKIATALSGFDAIDLVRGGGQYDIVFMDHMMPKMDGIEAARRLRMNGYMGAMVALTANALRGSEKMFRENGFDEFLSKPINVKKLDAILKKWIPEEKRNAELKSKDNSTADDVDVRSALAHASINTVRIPHSAFHIDGVDVKVGINRCGGTVANYIKTLGVFCDDGHVKISEIKKSLADNDLSSYAIYVHALKSALANIGANDLSARAKLLEDAAKRVDRAFVCAHTDELLGDLKTLLSDVSKVVIAQKEARGEIHADTDALNPILTALKTALENIDIAAINDAAAQLEPFENIADAGEKIKRITQDVLNGDYDEAEAVIDSLLK